MGQGGRCHEKAEIHLDRPEDLRREAMLPRDKDPRFGCPELYRRGRLDGHGARKLPGSYPEPHSRSDKDFSNILKFPPNRTPGIIVVREDGLKEATMRRRLFLFLESTDLRTLRGVLTVFSARSIRKRES